MTEAEVKFMQNPENAYACDRCPENKNDPDYQAGGRLKCGQWQCWVVLRTETWRNSWK